MCRLITIACLGVVVLSAAAVAQDAQSQPSQSQPSEPPAEPLSAQDEEARQLYRAGTVAYDSGLYDAALMHFERAYELSGRPELLYNVGLAADRARNDQRALEAYRQFLEAARDHPEHPSVTNRVRALERAELSAQSAAQSTQTDLDLTTPAQRRRRVIGGVIGAVLAVGIGVLITVLIVRDPGYDPARQVGDVGDIIQVLRPGA